MFKRSLKYFFSLLCCLFLIVGCKTDTDIVNEPLKFESKSNTTIFNVWDMGALTSTDSKVQVQMNLSEIQGEHYYYQTPTINKKTTTNIVMDTITKEDFERIKV